MVKYILYIFLENLAVNYMLINQVIIFTKSKNNKLFEIIGVFILAIYSTIIYFYKDEILFSIIAKILIVSICLYIVYSPKTLIEYIKKQLYYYLFSFLYVGIIISITILFKVALDKFYVKLILYITSATILYVFNKNLWKVWKTNIKNNDLTYTIYIGGQEIKAFIDTGNNVKDYINNLDVIFLSKELFWVFIKENIVLNKVKINFNTINTSESLDGYIVKNIDIYKNNKYISTIKKIVVVFAENNIKNNLNCLALIGYNTYLEKIKGVKIC